MLLSLCTSLMMMMMVIMIVMVVMTNEDRTRTLHPERLYRRLYPKP